MNVWQRIAAAVETVVLCGMESCLHTEKENKTEAGRHTHNHCSNLYSSGLKKANNCKGYVIHKLILNFV
jgi:hypothetical protein